VHRLDAGAQHLGDVRRVGERDRDDAEHDDGIRVFMIVGRPNPIR
jgi:hypothetical protein